MSAQFGLRDLAENESLKPIDIADAIVYALGVPKRVNVSKKKNKPTIFNDV